LCGEIEFGPCVGIYRLMGSLVFTVLCKIIENPENPQLRTSSPTEICTRRVYSTTTKYKWLPSCQMVSHIESRSRLDCEESVAQIHGTVKVSEPRVATSATLAFVFCLTTALLPPFKLPLVERYNGSISRLSGLYTVHNWSKSFGKVAVM